MEVLKRKIQDKSTFFSTKAKNTNKNLLIEACRERIVKYLWIAVGDFINFCSFVRLCMKFNTFFAFINLSFLKAILTS